MCVRSSVTPKEKKQMATNKLWGGSKPELLEETNGMDVADEIVFLNREVRRLSSVCSEYRKEIDKYEDDLPKFLTTISIHQLEELIDNITKNIDYEQLKNDKQLEELLSKFKDFKEDTEKDIFDKLDKMDIKVIEKYLRKKKLEILEKLK